MPIVTRNKRTAIQFLAFFNAMAVLNPKGFRRWAAKRDPKTGIYDRSTRGDRKRAWRAAANAKVSEERPDVYCHSVERKRRRGVTRARR